MIKEEKQNDINFDEYAKRKELFLEDLLILFEGELRVGMDSMYAISNSEITLKVEVDEAFNLLDPDAQITLLESQKELTLALPCTPEQLTDWVTATCDDFALPEAFTNKSGGKSKENIITLIKIEKACQEWLEGLMANNAPKKKTKGAYRIEAEELFKDIGTKPFDRAWSNAISATGNINWSRAGKPKGK